MCNKVLIFKVLKYSGFFVACVFGLLGFSQKCPMTVAMPVSIVAVFVMVISELFIKKNTINQGKIESFFLYFRLAVIILTIVLFVIVIKRML